MRRLKYIDKGLLWIALQVILQALNDLNLDESRFKGSELERVRMYKESALVYFANNPETSHLWLHLEWLGIEHKGPIKNPHRLIDRLLDRGYKSPNGASMKRRSTNQK